MTRSGAFIDTNLLVLLTVGSLDPLLISKHKRSKDFSIKEYEILVSLIEKLGKVYVLPNILAETSNLLGQHREPQRGQLLDQLQRIIEASREVIVTSVRAVRNPHFRRLGLNDAALLEVASKKHPLVTDDLKLFDAAERIKHGIAYHFQQFNPDNFGWLEENS